VLPVLEGTIARRVLLNFRADPEVVRRLVPAPLEVAVQNGAAVVGVCLIRLAQLRPRGLPGFVGIASENMAHRVAIRYPTPEGPRDGIFIWQRHSDSALLCLAGGRLFPGVHHRARFHPVEDADGLWMEVRTEGGAVDVTFHASEAPAFAPTPAFPTFEDARAFFARGDCGFSCSLDGGRLEAMRVKTRQWAMSPLVAADVRAAFYEAPSRFPPGSIAFDGAVVMRGIPHEWHELSEVPELAGARF
jgi:Uncharacterized conserved protein (COG2071)